MTCPLPDDEEPWELLRVVTCPPEEADPPAEDPECDALVRVVTGALEDPELDADDPVECEALVRVVTGAVPATKVPADPATCEPLAWVRTALAGRVPTPPPVTLMTPYGLAPRRACS